MALSKVTYVDGVTVIGATNLNDIQDNVIGNAADITTLGSTKVDKVEGKGLSENDFTDTLKNKLDGIQAGAQVNPGNATTSAAGLMSAADKTKLNGIASGATNVTIDSTLTQSGQAADAKKTGDEVATLKSQIDGLDETVYTTTESTETVTLTTATDGYYDTNGHFNSGLYGRRYAVVSPVVAGETYYLSTYTSSTAVPGIVYFKANDVFYGYDKNGTGSGQMVTDYEFTIPDTVVKLVVQSAANTVAGTPALKKKVTSKSFSAYTKTESDTITDDIYSRVQYRYGIKWEIGNNDDLGARCFDAVGKSATIGVGSTNGSSDFDTIYPWSEIKRCNISKNANGAETVTFEGETGFALDGTNGDVFVRIPKFYYERYRLNGYEYRVISAEGTTVHPAFVEDGKELDEIFISAFEGTVVDNKLRSIGGVMPTSNLTAQTFLIAAQANGDNYSLYDSRCVDAVWALMAIEYGNRNTNRILGYGLANFEQAVKSGRNLIRTAATSTNTVRTSKWTSVAKEFIPVGANITVCNDAQTTILTQAKVTACVDSGDYTDWTFDGDPIDVDTDCFIGSAAFNTNWCEGAPNGALSWHTGRENWSTIAYSGRNNQHAIRYRWIENVFGNLWQFLPDITFDALQMYVCKSMKDYEMHKKTGTYYPENKLFTKQASNGVKSDDPNKNYWITDLDNGEFTKGTDFGRTFTQDITSVKAFGAYYYLFDTLVSIVNGGGFDHYYRCNMLTNRAWIASTDKWFLYGARLMYKHLA